MPALATPPPTATPAVAAPTPAAAPSATPTPSTPVAAAPTPEKQVRRKGNFVSNAVKSLTSTPDPVTPVAAAPDPEKPAVAAAPPVVPAAAVVPTTPDADDAAAEADIKRETAAMPAGQKAAFTKLRYAERDLRRQLKAAHEELTAAKGTVSGEAATPEIQAEVARLTAENAAAKARLEKFETESFATHLEVTEEYQRAVTQPRDAVSNALATIASGYEIAPEALIDAVRSGDAKKISTITADMSEFDRFKFYEGVQKYHQVNQTEADLRKNSKEALEKISTQRRGLEESRTATEKADWEKAIPAAWQRLTEEFPAIAPIEGNATWNAKVEGVKTFAAPERFGKLTVTERAEVLQRSAAFPVLAAELDATVNALAEAQGKLARYEAATPGLGGGGSSDGDPAAPAGGPRRSFVDQAVSRLKKI